MLNAQESPLILIADDDLDSRDMYEYFLRQRGCRIAVAGNGAEVVKKACQLQPDVIVMDLSMPTMGGEEATTILKNSAKTEKIPVVVLTAHAREGAATVRNMACQGFLIKPCAPEGLYAEIVRVLKKSS